jgi:hypothetical protein
MAAESKMAAKTFSSKKYFLLYNFLTKKLKIAKKNFFKIIIRVGTLKNKINKI